MMHSVNSQNTTDWMPDARGQAVLLAIIKEHLVTGEPIGSRTVAQSCAQNHAKAAGWSAATIRNVMAELEEAGLVEQPHTSAGRVPTDKGYRFYVNHITRTPGLSRFDLTTVERAFGFSLADQNVTPGRLMEKISHLLSDLSENVGIVISPSLAENRLQHIEFVRLTDERILVVLVSASNIVQNKIVRIDERLGQDELDRTARYLNAEFSGKSLVVIQSEILEMLRAERQRYDKLLHNAMLLCEQSLAADEEAATAEVYVDGASNILDKPDFTDAKELRQLFRTLEEKSRLVKILNECIVGEPSASDVRVVIGREHAAPSMQNCALITASYRVGTDGAMGALGVVGPMRIEYARMMAVVTYVARMIERLLREESTAA